VGIRPVPPRRDTVPLIELEDVERAARRLAGIAHRTPVLTSRTLDERTGARVAVKAECFQRGGAFKFRGAYNKISSLDEDALRRGVIAYSSGNHAQAVAIAAALLGSHATIVMPEDAPAAKRDATRGYGAEIVNYDRWTESREEIGARLAEERGLELVKPYDDPLVMAGQGTVALELLEEAPELDVLLVPVSGGGLIAGCATVAKALRQRIRVVGVEPEAGDDTRRSLATGERVRIDVPRTIADGLQATEPGELTFEVNRERVDEVVTVTDDEVVEAMVFLFDRLKLVAEPSGAAGVAALLSGRLDARDASVGIVLSGGNVGAGRFAELVASRPAAPAG
jgi:threonine dehydratase